MSFLLFLLLDLALDVFDFDFRSFLEDDFFVFKDDFFSDTFDFLDLLDFDLSSLALLLLLFLSPFYFFRFKSIFY